MPTARVSSQARRVSTRRRRTSHRQGPRAPTALVDRMVVAASLMVLAYTDRLMRALEPLLQERYGQRQDAAGVLRSYVRLDALSLDDVFESVREGELSRQFLERMFHQVDNQAANDLQRVVPVPLSDVLPDAARMQAAWVEKNTELIRLEERARQEVRAIIEAPIQEGVRVEEIRAQIQERMGVVQSRAELIARDQTLKVYGQIQEARQTDAGIEEYDWSTSDDERVRGNPSGVYPKSHGNHWKLEGTRQRWDSPPIVDERTGRREHPGGDFQCRCAAIPVLPTGEEAPISETRPSRRAPANDVPPPEERALAGPLEVADPLEVERERLAAEERKRLAAESVRPQTQAERQRERSNAPKARLEQRIPSVQINSEASHAARQAVADAVETVDLPGVRALAMATELGAPGIYLPGEAKVAIKASRKPLARPLPETPGPGKLHSISSTAKTVPEAISKTTYHELGHHAHMHENARFVALGSVVALKVELLVEARWNAPDREYLTDYAVWTKTPHPLRASEYFAEAFAAYHTEPAWLKRVAPKAYQLVEAVLNLRKGIK